MNMFEKFSFRKKKGFSEVGAGEEPIKETPESSLANSPIKLKKENIKKPTKKKGGLVELPSDIERKLGPRDELLEKALKNIDEKIKNLNSLTSLLKGPESVKNDPEGVRFARECYIKAQTYLLELNMLDSKFRYEKEINNKKDIIKSIAERMEKYLPKIVAAQNKIMAVKSQEDLRKLVEESRKEVAFISENVGTEKLLDFDAEDDLLLELRPDFLRKKSNELDAGIEKTNEFEELQKLSQEAKRASWF